MIKSRKLKTAAPMRHRTSIPTSLMERGPDTLLETFRWAPRFLSRLQKDMPNLARRLSKLNVLLTSSFSGVGCPESSTASLFSAIRGVCDSQNLHPPSVQIGNCIEWHKPCQKVLKEVHALSCGFTDICGLVRRRCADVELVSHATCFIHQKQCPVQAGRVQGRLRVEAAGPPCVNFSRIGRREKSAGEGYVCHDAWQSLIATQRAPLVIFENVPDYERALLQDGMSDYDLRFATLCPRDLGFPAARPRLWCVGVLRAKGKWLTDEPLQSLLAPLRSAVATGFDMFFYLPDEPYQRGAMAPYQEKHIAAYNKRCPESQLLDLSQNPESTRGRTETRDGCLPTLTTNSKQLFHQGRCRTLQPEEMMASLCLPVTPAFAAAAHAPRLPFELMSPTQQARAAGNGMHTACFGAILLIALLHTKFVDP